MLYFLINPLIAWNKFKMYKLKNHMYNRITLKFQSMQNNTVSSMCLTGGNIQYKQKNKSEITYQTNQSGQEIFKVYDQKCQLVKKRAIKTIKVKLGDKTITVTDYANVEKPHQNIKKLNQLDLGETYREQNSIQGQQSQEQVGSQDQSSSQQNQSHTKLTSRSIKNTSNKIKPIRNINKNIFKAFYQYCIRQGSDEQKQFARLLILKNNFAHKAFQGILSNQKSTEMLYRFLNKQFENWLCSSRILHKQAYRQRCDQISKMLEKFIKKE